MKQLGCIRAGMLLDQRAAGLSAAEALRLEEHLASCERCGEDARLLDGLRALSDTRDTTLDAHARTRAIEAAFAQVHVPRRARERSIAQTSVRLGAAFALAAAFAFALRAGLERPATPAPRAPLPAPAVARVEAPTAARVDHVLDGAVEIDGQLQAAGAQLGSLAALHASADAHLALAQANVELRAGSDVRWNAGARVLRVEAGSVLADVDPSAHQSFVVETARFRVLVLGTRFEVTQDGVRVERGRVRVVAPDGSVLAERVDAGQQYVVAGEAATARPEAAPPRREHARSARPGPAPADAAALLEHARAQLGAKRVSDARAAIDSALALHPETRVRAEALTLRAECALVEGDLGGAVEAYERVARSFAASPAGENALFAAARIEAERGHSAAAVQLLERDLEQYPHGRFEQEARARLQKLSAVLDRAP